MGAPPGSPARAAAVTAAAFVTPTPSRAAVGVPTAGTSWMCPRHASWVPVARRQRHAATPCRWLVSPPAATPDTAAATTVAPRSGALSMQAGGGGKKKDGSTASPLVRGVTAFLLAAFLAGSFVPFLPTLTAFIKGDAAGTAISVLEARLRKVPVFAVTDGEGKPYLTVDEAAASAAGVGGGGSSGGGAVGYFFLDVADASAYLDAVRAQLPTDEVTAATSPILFPVGLDEALAFTSPASSTAAAAARRANGVGASERFVLRPSAEEAATAEALTGGAFAARFGADAVPLFYIDGLAVVDEPADGGALGGTVYPLFFRKAELDTYVAAAEARDAAGVAAVRADGRLEVRVVDLSDVVAEIRRGGAGRLGQVVFSPPADSVAFMQQRLAATGGGEGGGGTGADAGAQAVAPAVGKGGSTVEVGAAAMTTPFGGK